MGWDYILIRDFWILELWNFKISKIGLSIIKIDISGILDIVVCTFLKYPSKRRLFSCHSFKYHSKKSYITFVPSREKKEEGERN